MYPSCIIIFTIIPGCMVGNQLPITFRYSSSFLSLIPVIFFCQNIDNISKEGNKFWNISKEGNKFWNIPKESNKFWNISKKATSFGKFPKKATRFGIFSKIATSFRIYSKMATLFEHFVQLILTTSIWSVFSGCLLTFNKPLTSFVLLYAWKELSTVEINHRSPFLYCTHGV